MAIRLDPHLGADLSDPRTFVPGVPHEVFTRLRREAPVAWLEDGTGGGHWTVTRHADVVAVNRDN
jgi:hypothetical protein